ncbi:hypothetical protein CRN40_13975 [Vibrio vulnificus]|nr:hypothetical protein CRN40_13975 [Vibrio vulnificus]
MTMTSVNASANNCEINGYTIGFFNGVATSNDDAKDALRRVRSTIATQQYRGQPVEYALFYNDSNYKERGIDVLADFAETFDQRTNELEQKQFERWEAFWDVVSGRNNSPIIKKYDIDDRDVSPYIEGGYLKCAGTGSFSELVAIQSGYSDDEKRYLNTEQLTGTYELNAQKISHHCGGH